MGHKLHEHIHRTTVGPLLPPLHPSPHTHLHTQPTNQPTNQPVLSGRWRRSMVTLDWSVAVLLCLSLDHCRPFNVLNFGVPSLICNRTGRVTWVLTTSMLLGRLVGCWIRAGWMCGVRLSSVCGDGASGRNTQAPSPHPAFH